MVNTYYPQLVVKQANCCAISGCHWSCYCHCTNSQPGRSKGESISENYHRVDTCVNRYTYIPYCYIQRAPPLIGRFVPFAAVAAANAINIPLMRQRELRNGVPIFDEQNNRLGLSKVSTILSAIASNFMYIVITIHCKFLLEGS